MVDFENLKFALNELLNDPSKEVFLDGFEPINDWRLAISLSKKEFWYRKMSQVLTLQDSLIDGTMGIFKVGFSSFDFFEALTWLSSKLELLERERIEMKKFGFEQYRHSAFLFENESTSLDISRGLEVDYPTGVNEISQFVIYHGDMDLTYLSKGSMMDQLKKFFLNDLPVNDYLLFPPQIRDRLVGELA